LRIDRRYVVSGRRRYDRRAMRDHEYIRHHSGANLTDGGLPRLGESRVCGGSPSCSPVAKT
jgi:hypothetical protein